VAGEQGVDFEWVLGVEHRAGAGEARDLDRPQFGRLAGDSGHVAGELALTLRPAMAARKCAGD
jgi:hypothetical protein